MIDSIKNSTKSQNFTSTSYLFAKKTASLTLQIPKQTFIITNSSNREVNEQTTKRIFSNYFTDFYGSYDYDKILNNVNSSSPQFFGLFSSDYDAAVQMNLNDSSASLNYYSDDNNTDDGKSLLNGQLSVPLLYIMFMFILYFIIICALFMSALYSHRKRIGYNYDDSLDVLSQNEENLQENNANNVEMKQPFKNKTKYNYFNNKKINNNNTESEDDHDFVSENNELIQNRKIQSCHSNKIIKTNKNKVTYKSLKTKQTNANKLKMKNNGTNKIHFKSLNSKRIEKSSFLMLKKLFKLLPDKRNKNTKLKNFHNRDYECNESLKNDNKNDESKCSIQPLLFNGDYIDENEF
jgi:hypothetical protein